MRIYNKDEMIDTDGSMVLLYGESGTGKSVTTIQTAPDPILYLMAEPRSVNKMIAAAQRPDVKIKFGFYEGWDDIMEFVSNKDNFTGAKTIVIDSLTHLMSIGLSDELMEESYESLDKKKGVEKDLTMRVKMSIESYGALSGQMLRFTNAISKLSQIGYIVICLARVEQNPKFNRALAAAPSFRGKEYMKYVAGFMDYIGLVESRVEDSMVVYPPLVSFQDDGSYISKWCGIMPEGGVYKRVLNIEKILNVAHGKNGK
jgi:hypothetical protein